MAVVVANNKACDLGDSLLQEDDVSSPPKKITATVFGCVALDEEMRVLPLISAFLNHMLISKNVSFDTVKTYGNNLLYLVDYLKGLKRFKSFPLDDCLIYATNPTIFTHYFNYLRNTEGLKSVTVRNRDATYLSFYNEFLCKDIGKRDALCEDNPYEDGLLSGAPKKSLIIMCELDELYGLMRSTTDERERCLLQFMYDSGLRCSEIPRVTKHDIEVAINSNSNNLILDDNTVSVPSNYKMLYVEGSKSRNREIKPRYTLISESTLLRVKRFHSSPLYRKHSRKFTDNSKPAFLNSLGTSYTKQSISKLLQRLSKRAIKHGLLNRMISPHKLRHGFAGSVLRSPDLGKESLDRLVACQHCLGHNSIETTEMYTKIPYEIYGYLVKDTGEIYKRHEVMDLLTKRTKVRIGLRDIR